MPVVSGGRSRLVVVGWLLNWRKAITGLHRAGLKCAGLDCAGLHCAGLHCAGLWLTDHRTWLYLLTELPGLPSVRISLVLLRIRVVWIAIGTAGRHNLTKAKQ